MKKLTENQIVYLNVFRGIKSAYRKEELTRKMGQELSQQIESELVALGVLKRDKRGSLRGPSYDEIGTMIRLSTLTVDQMLEERKSNIERAAQLVSDIERLTKEDPNFCFYSRDLYDSLRYTREQIQKWDKDIELAQKQTA